MMFDDTALMRLVIDLSAKRLNLTYEEIMEKFYHSNTCKHISNKATGYFTFAPIEIVELFEEELSAS